MAAMQLSDLPAPGLDDIAALAHAARDALPPEFRGPAADVAIRVEDFASPDLLAEMQMEIPTA